MVAVNKEDLRNNIDFYIEHGYHHPDTLNSVKLFMEEELGSLHNLKLRLENQKYAYNNLLSIVDRCEKFKIEKEVFKEEITLPLPQEEYLAENVDYSFYLERMIDAIIKNKIKAIEASANTRSINREEVFEEEELDAVKAEEKEEPTEGELAEQPEDNPLKEVEETVEKFEEVTKNLEEKVAEIGNLAPQKVESAAKETLNEIREMEEELRKEIEAEEQALTPKQRKGMRRWLGDFWNGVSSGWDN